MIHMEKVHTEKNLGCGVCSPSIPHMGHALIHNQILLFEDRHWIIPLKLWARAADMPNSWILKAVLTRGKAHRPGS